MYGLAESTWEEWKRKRRNTLIGLVLIGISVGIDCSMVFSTLFLYLRDLVKTDQPEMWYGLIIAVFYISSSIFGTFCGRWLDKTRRVRAYVNMTLLVQILGFVIYTIPYHPMFLLVGRTICGINDTFAAIVSGEIFRIYDEQERTRAMIWLYSVWAIGFVIGPALILLFTEISFNVGTIKINYMNFIGIFMCGLMLVEILVSRLLLHNCSLQFDLKDHLKISSERTTLSPNTELSSISSADIISEETEEDTETAIVIQTKPSQTIIPIKTIIKVLLSNKDTLLILVATFIFMYGIFATTALFPLIVTVTLQWDIKYLSIIYSGCGVFELLVLFLLAKCVKSNRSIYLACLMCIVSQVVSCCILICLKVLDREFKRDVFLIVLLAITLTLGYSFDDVMIKVIFANMVPSKIQSFSESLRSGVSRLAIVAGSFTVAVILPWAHLWSAVIMIIYFMLFVGFIVRKRHLINPMEIPFETPCPSGPVRCTPVASRRLPRWKSLPKYYPP